jgi:purine-binding chemotaxis protein CheW
MDVGYDHTGFIVDGVSEVIRIRSSELQQPPSMALSGGTSQEFITGVLNHTGKLLIVMDADWMFSDEERNNLRVLEND